MEVEVGSRLESGENEGFSSSGESVDNDIHPNTIGVNSVSNIPCLVLLVSPDQRDGVDGLFDDLEVGGLDVGSSSGGRSSSWGGSSNEGRSG